MRYLLSIILILSLFACNERIVQLPETHNQDITEVLDISPIYLFYLEEKDSVEFNRKNMISTTNWLVNVDKRLTLKQALPHLTYLQDKRKKAGMHKNDEARNYFTCSNPVIKNLAFIDFTSVEYTQKEQLETQSDSTSIKLIFDRPDVVEIHTSDNAIVMTNVSSLLDSLREKTSSDQTISLNLNENLSFQDYILLKSELLKLDADAPSISKSEIIYK